MAFRVTRASGSDPVVNKESLPPPPANDGLEFHTTSMSEGDYTRYMIHLTSTLVTLDKTPPPLAAHPPRVPCVYCSSLDGALYTPMRCHRIYSYVLRFEKYALVLASAVFDVHDWGIQEKMNEFVVPGDFIVLRSNCHTAAGG